MEQSTIMNLFFSVQFSSKLIQFARFVEFMQTVYKNESNNIILIDIVTIRYSQRLETYYMVIELQKLSVYLIFSAQHLAFDIWNTTTAYIFFQLDFLQM